MPSAEVALPTTDKGFKRCNMCYEAIHVWRGRFFCLEDRLHRFFRAIEKRRFNFPQSRGQPGG